jgi:predicted site-specific integrase-resolvase
MMVLSTRQEAAQRMGISTATLDRERIAGQLAYIQRKPGGKVWISEDAISEYLARATHPAQPERINLPALRKRRSK